MSENETPNADPTPPPPPGSAPGIKYDSGKVRMELLSRIYLWGVAAVLTYGARKYESHGWRKGIARTRLIGGALRHLTAYMDGEDNDPETGICHLFHASCMIMFASEDHYLRPALDDRYRVPREDMQRIMAIIEGGALALPTSKP